MASWKQQRRKWAHRLGRSFFRGLDAKLSGTLQLQMLQQTARYEALLRSGEPLPSLEDTEFRVFSQNGEDGIILFLLAVIGTEHKRFLEIGIQEGWECNAANLAKHRFWDGWFVEGDPEQAALARQHYALDAASRQRRVHVVESFVTRENINDLLVDNGIRDVDLFSLDIDGVDWWVWQALTGIRPRIAVMEYNAAFGSEPAVTVPYQPRFDRQAAHPSGLCFGASLAALVKLGRQKGYDFVGCESSGTNAFFVREDVRPANLPVLTTAQGYRESMVLGDLARRYGGDPVREMELVTV